MSIPRIEWTLIKLMPQVRTYSATGGTVRLIVDVQPEVTRMYLTYGGKFLTSTEADDTYHISSASRAGRLWAEAIMDGDFDTECPQDEQIRQYYQSSPNYVGTIDEQISEFPLAPLL